MRFCVIAMFESVAALHPFDLEGTRRLASEVPDALISFNYKGGIVGLRGTLHRRGDLVRFNVSDGVSLPRRSSTRVDLVAPVTVRRPDGSSVDGITVDVALDGVLVETDPPLDIGEKLFLSITFSTRALPVEAGARVVRRIGLQAGIAFNSIAQEDRRFLSLQIYEQSLASLRRRLSRGRDDDDVFF